MPKYLVKFNQNINCFIYIKFKNNNNDILNKNILILNQLSIN